MKQNRTKPKPKKKKGLNAPAVGRGGVYGPLVDPAPAPPPTTVGQGPVRPEVFPIAVLPFFDVTKSALEQVAAGVVQVHAALDLRALDDGQRKLVQDPNTARAVVVAQQQIEVMVDRPDLAQAANYPVAFATQLVDDHLCLDQGVVPVGEFVMRLGNARLVLQADRAMAREAVRTHIDETLAGMSADDPRRGRYEAAQAHLQAAEQGALTAAGTQRDKKQQQTQDALGQIQAAQDDLHLANVVHQLRQGIQPSAADLQKAALHLQKVEAAQAAQAAGTTKADARHAAR